MIYDSLRTASSLLYPDHRPGTRPSTSPHLWAFPHRETDCIQITLDLVPDKTPKQPHQTPNTTKMSSLQQVVGKSFKMVIRQSPDKAAEKRRRLEALQAVDRPIILASRYNFSPALTFSRHQKHDPILQAAYPILHNFSYSTFAGYMNPLEIEPLFSDDAVFLHQAMFYGCAASAMYAIGRYGMIAKVRLFINASDGQVFVQDQLK